jgi:hypothetical protein
MKQLMLAGALALAAPMIAPPAFAETGRARSRIATPPGYTELRVAPPPGGTVYVYEGHRLLGRFDREGAMLVATGRDYRVVAMRGDEKLWAGDVTASGLPLELDWSMPSPRFRQPFPPPSGPSAEQPPLGQSRHEVVLPQGAQRSLLRQLDRARDDQSRIEALADATTRYALSSAQAASILDRFRTDAYRLAALEWMSQKIIPSDEAPSLVDRFRSPAARRMARDILSD